MKKRSARKAISLGGQPTFSWQHPEDSQNSALAAPESAPQRSARPWLILASCILLLLLVGFWAWQRVNERAESNLALVEAEVAQAFISATTSEKTADNASRQPTNAAQRTPSPTQFVAGSDAEVTLLELYGSLALVDVIFNNPAEAWYHEPYHVARIVQLEADGWNQIAPTNTFWNERRTLETTYFHLEYGRRDQAVVEEVAAGLDDLYLRLHSDLGLPTPGSGKRLDLRILVVEGSEVRVTDVRHSGDTLYVAPPELIPRPLTISTAETLRQAIAFPLSTKMFNVALSEYNVPCYWRSVGEGIGLWLRWEGHTLPSRRQWEYDRAIQEALTGVALPTLADLRSIPRDCWQPPPFLEMDEINAERQLPRNELAATLIEYIVATYGRDSVATLLRDLRRHADWNTLALNSVNLSADELETGWHAYLESHVR